MKLSIRLLSFVLPDSLKLSQSNLVPELRLHLLTSNHPLWHAPNPNHFQEERTNDPFWAVFWPGGQVLSRYILDTKVAYNQRVLDLGCGCGAQGLSAALTGAQNPVTFNDIDSLALKAVALNAQANHLDLNHITLDDTDLLQNVQRSSEDLSDRFDILLMGDMFFDEELGIKLSKLATLFKATSPSTKKVLIGDPGRWLLAEKGFISCHLNCVGKYHLGQQIQQEHYGLTNGWVYEVKA